MSGTDKWNGYGTDIYFELSVPLENLINFEL